MTQEDISTKLDTKSQTVQGTRPDTSLAQNFLYDYEVKIILSMDITNILNSKGPAAAAAAAAAAEQQLQQRLASATQENGTSFSDTGSERDMSPRTSDPSTKYPSRSAQPLHTISNMTNGTRYPSPSQLGEPMSMVQNGYLTHNSGMENGFAHSQQHQQIENHGSGQARTTQSDGGSVAMKAFACNSCGKGFARRSDLARHGIVKFEDSFAGPKLTINRTNTHWCEAACL